MRTLSQIAEGAIWFVSVAFFTMDEVAICSTEAGHAAFDGKYDQVRLLRLVDCVRFDRVPLFGLVVDLRVSFCPCIAVIPDLAGLRFLTIRECVSLVKIQCTSLDTLVVTDCALLDSVPSAATEIILSDCSMLTVLDGVETPALTVMSCSNLATVRVNALKVAIEQCPRLTSLMVPMVRELCLDKCSALAKLQRAWPRVVKVTINRCASLTRLPRQLMASRETEFLYDEPRDVRLYECGVLWLEMGRGFVGTLSVNRCMHLKTIAGAGSAVSEMSIYACPELSSLPVDLPQLQKLRLLECHSLTTVVVPASATYVSVIMCRMLATMTLGKLLLGMKIWTCPMLSLPALPAGLRSLHLRMMPIELLPALPVSLTTLVITRCQRLLSIPPEIDNVTRSTVTGCSAMWPVVDGCGDDTGRCLASVYRASTVCWTPTSHRLFGERLNAAMAITALASNMHPDLLMNVFRRIRLGSLVA